MHGAIGVFDSGVGGLTVLAALRRALPGEDFVYLGDTARLPYGTKSEQTVRRYARQAAAKLTERGIKLLVVACNTASAVAIDDLADAFAPIPVVGVIDAGADRRSGRELEDADLALSVAGGDEPAAATEGERGDGAAEGELADEGPGVDVDDVHRLLDGEHGVSAIRSELEQVSEGAIGERGGALEGARCRIEDEEPAGVRRALPAASR